MQKAQIMQLFLDELDRELNTLVEAAFQAREAATSEESKPENKYDTRGLEASYLAGAQAKRASELRDFIDHLKRLEMKDFSSHDPIEATALVRVTSDIDGERLFFIVPKEGGAKFELNGEVIIVISPDSPMGQALVLKKVGDVFEFRKKGVAHEYEIISVQ